MQVSVVFLRFVVIVVINLGSYCMSELVLLVVGKESVCWAERSSNKCATLSGTAAVFYHFSTFLPGLLTHSVTLSPFDLYYTDWVCNCCVWATDYDSLIASFSFYFLRLTLLHHIIIMGSKKTCCLNAMRIY